MPWRILLCLTIAALLWRGVIPVGYMPNARAAEAGRLLLTLCTSTGATATQFIDVSGDTRHAPPDDAKAGNDCPFGLLASQAILLPAPLLQAVGLAQTSVDVLLPVYRSAPALPALGPPIGSRAPPTHLA